MAKEEVKREEKVLVNKNALIHTINYLVNRPFLEVEELVYALRRELFLYEEELKKLKDAKPSNSSRNTVPD